MAVPSVAVEPVFGKKFTNQLGGMANEAAAADVSAFARRQMEKMGWTEGKGLGKAEQGVVTHVRVQKREEFMGVRVFLSDQNACGSVLISSRVCGAL